MSTNVWASSKDVPGIVCSDARLTDRSTTQWPWQTRPTTTKDQVYGQAGWDRGINFSSLDDLASKIAAFDRGEIRRLAIHAHGVPGTLFINGQDGPALTADTVLSNHGALHNIGLRTPDDAKNPAVILLVGCLAGSGKDGTRLMVALSRVWPNRKVVAFGTLGYVGGEMKRSGEFCTETGMRDTDALYPGDADKDAGKFWKDLEHWPWANENSPHAKVVLNQTVILGPNW